jgi:AsmA protein
MSLPRPAIRALVALAVLVGVALAAAFVLPHLVDLNRYREPIASSLRAATGRDVDLGAISFALLPSPSLRAGPLRVAEGPRYPGRQALTARALSVRLGLLSLLRGRIAFRSIVLDHPSLTLIRDARGRWNFDDVLERLRTAGGGRGGASTGASPATGSGPDLTIARAVIRAGSVRVYDDAVVAGARSEVLLEPVAAVVQGWGSGTGTRFSLSLGLGKSSLRVEGRLSDGKGSTLDGSVEAPSLEAADLARLLPWLGVARPRGLEVGGAVALSGRAVLSLDRPEAARFSGTIRLADLSYRDAAMTRPVGGLRGLLKIDGDRATWSDFAVRIGSSSLEGKLTLEDFLHPRAGFALTSPRLDFNEILGTFGSSGAPPGAGAAGSAGGAASGEVPGLVRDLAADGTLGVRAIRFLTFDLGEARARVRGAGGRFALEDLETSFYGGTLRGEARVDLSAPTPRHALGVQIAGTGVDPLLTAYDPGLAGLLRGTLAGRLDLQASGLERAAILAGASGTGSLQVSRGSLTSFSVLKQLAALLEMAGGKGIGREETPFETLSAHLAIGGGRARTDDLALRSADLDLDGSGSVGLDASLDLDLAVRFSQAATRGMVAKTPRLESLADRDGRLTLHVSLGGNLASPTFRLDLNAQARQVREKQKERVLDALRDRLRKSLGGSKDAPPPEPGATAPEGPRP